MATAKRTGRVGRWLASAGLLTFPACSTLDTAEPPTKPLPTPGLAARVTTQGRGMPAVIPAGAQVEARDDKDVPTKKPALTLPATPAAGTQGKPLPIDLPTALTLSDANPLDIQIAGERLRPRPPPSSTGRTCSGCQTSRSASITSATTGRSRTWSGDVFTTSQSSFLLGGGPNCRVLRRRCSLRSAGRPAGGSRPPGRRAGSSQRHNPAGRGGVLHRPASSRRSGRLHRRASPGRGTGQADREASPRTSPRPSRSTGRRPKPPAVGWRSRRPTNGGRWPAPT